MRPERVFAALGDETRLRIVSRLGERGRLSIVTLTEGTRVTRQAISKHLRVLEDAGLVRSARRGRENIFELDVERLKEAQRFLERRSQQWDSALRRLKRFVER